MKLLRQLWKDNRGLATSLMEVTLVLAISAVISGVAISLTNDQLDGANEQSCNGELKLLGVSLLAFMQDTGKTPAFRQGTATGPEAAYFSVLESGGPLRPWCRTGPESTWRSGYRRPRSGQRDRSSS